MTEPCFPPLLSGLAVTGAIDPFDKACAMAALGCDAGLIVHNITADRLMAALVMAPDVPLEDAMAMLPACGVGFQNALGALAPPEVAVHLDWDGGLRINGASCGRMRVAAGGTDPAAEPGWLVVGLDLPLMQVSADRLAAGRAEWERTLAPLPRPLVAVLIGGPTSPYVYNAETAARLRARAERVLADGGTPWLVGSRRTPPGFLERVRRGLDDRLRVFDWARPGGSNPYTGLLAMADRFVVTGDSISMQVEVARLGKPLEIVPLPFGWLGRADDARRRAAAWMFQPPRDDSAPERARLAAARGLYHLRLMQQTRHFPRFHQALVDRGLASWAGTEGPDGTGDPPVSTAAADDVTRILRRIDPLVHGA